MGDSSGVVQRELLDPAEASLSDESGLLLRLDGGVSSTTWG